jgi:hypothetical protein
MEIVCDICECKIKHKKDLPKHKKSETCKKIEYLLTKQIQPYKEKIQEYITHNNNLQKQLEEKDIQIKTIQDKAEEYRKIVEKSALKSTNTVKNNYTHNNYLNYISQEPINFSNLKNELKNVVTSKTIMYDDEYFNDHIVNQILKDKNGKDKVLCTDINRKNFSYKDENTGQLISDPELDNLRTKLRNGVKLKQLRSELLEKLTKEFEDNGNVGKDPYVKFYEMIQKLNFGVPFVDHVAKKTYVKSKNQKDTSKLTFDKQTIAQIPLVDKNEEVNRTNNRQPYKKYTEEEIEETIMNHFSKEEYLEYKELMKEFGHEYIVN